MQSICKCLDLYYDKVDVFIGNKLSDGAFQLLPWYNFQIEIMKRLHREAFADLMKLRDRQDKVEKMLTYMSVKGSPFQKDGTLVRGEVDVTGALSLKDYLDQDNVDAMKRAGMRTGINAKIIFETIVREKNIIEAEFIANPSNNIDSSNIPGSALSLAKLSYRGNVTDWCSMVAIPMGAKCKDLSSAIDPSFEVYAI